MFEAAAHAASSPPKESGGAAGQQRRVQSALIRGPEHWRRLLTDVLPAWVQPVGWQPYILIKTLRNEHYMQLRRSQGPGKQASCCSLNMQRALHGLQSYLHSSTLCGPLKSEHV